MSRFFVLLLTFMKDCGFIVYAKGRLSGSIKGSCSIIKDDGMAEADISCLHTAVSGLFSRFPC